MNNISVDNLHILVMAGGEGTRFYPVSTPEKPKQFLNFLGERTFIQQTYDRISDMVPDENIFVATNKKYIRHVKHQLPDVPLSNIIGETEKKNTGPCIAYAAQKILQKDPNAVMVVLPSDHLIGNEAEFINVIKRAIYIASSRDVLVTLGINPTWSADCYGYLKIGAMIEDDPDGRWNAYTVDGFIEKPSVQTARSYIDEGDYFWNSGIFIWKAQLVLYEIAEYLPEMEKLVHKYAPDDNIIGFFKDVQAISIDYGIMEKSKRVVTIPCNIDWNDIGTWQSLHNLRKSTDLELAPHIVKYMERELGLTL